MADNTNSGTGVVSHLVDFFKHLVGFDLNAIISLAAPESTKMAQGLAEDIKKRFPEEHWLRGATAYRVVSILASRVETAAKSEPKPVQEILEKLSDFIEEFGQSLWDESSRAEDGQKSSSRPEVTRSPQAAQVFAELNKLFLEKSRLRLENASAADFKEIKKRVGTEARLLAELKVLMTEGPKEKPGSEPVKVKKKSLGKILGKWWRKGCELATEVWEAKTTNSTNKSLVAWIKKMKAKNEKDKKTHPKTDRLGRYLESPMKIIWGLVFGFGKK